MTSNDHTTSAIDAGYSANPKEMRRVLVSSFIGTAVEYYDFALFATAAGLVFNRVFFAGLDPALGLALSFTLLATGYVARPVGALIFGQLGDRLGRKTILMTTVLLMGVSSALMGALPTTAMVGVLAPILLVILRICQGIAVGGEWGGATLLAFENANRRSRGFSAAFAYMGAPAGNIVGLGILSAMAMLPEEQFIAWGWRVPFLFSVVLMMIAVFIRLRVTESRIFKEAAARSEKNPPAPIRKVFQQHPGALFRAFAVGLSGQAAQGLMGVWALAYAVQTAITSDSMILNLKAAAAVVTIFMLIVASRLSDRWGRRRILVLGNIGAILLAMPVLFLLDAGSPLAFFLAIVLGLSVVQGFTAGPYGAYASEQFPTSVRYTGTSVAYQIAATAGAGFSPLLATAVLAASGGQLWTVGLLWISYSAISLLGLLLSHDRSTLSITDLDAR